MAIDYSYIISKLIAFEGNKNVGYVPKKKGEVLGQSGVTIGMGVDLGQQTAEGLTKMGVPATIVGRLIPYIGLKRENAVYKLSKLPLVLSDDAVQALNDAVSRSYISATASRFNRLAAQSNTPNFADSPRQVQAVAVSVEYQLGQKGAAEYVRLLASGEYMGAAAALRNTDGAYDKRREQEADLIAEVLQ